MSPLAKVFVFLVTFLTICFLGVSATLYQVQMDWKKAAEETKAELAQLKEQSTEKYGEIRSERDTAITNYNTVKTSKAALEATNEALVAENRTLKQDKTSLNDTIAQQTESIQQKDSHIQQLDGEKSELIAQNDRLRGEAEDANKAKVAAELAMNRAELDRQQIEEESRNAQVELASFKEQVDELSLWRDHVLANNPTLADIGTPANPVDAAVVAIKDDVDLVVLSAGAEDKVKVGDLFTIYRGGSFVAKARVIRTTPDLAGARILYTNDGQSIRVGDSASSRMAY